MKEYQIKEVQPISRDESATSAKEQSPSQQSRRFCIGKGCTRQISSESLHRHNSCVKCRGGVCTPDSKRDECKEWQEDTVLMAYKYQHSLETQYKSFTKRFSSSLHSSAAPPVKQIIGSFVQDEVCRDCSVLSPRSSMDPGPSASQVVAPPSCRCAGTAYQCAFYHVAVCYSAPNLNMVFWLGSVGNSRHSSAAMFHPEFERSSV
ncbi:hypothetical protein E2C01_051607 [Portunus trituberculatus]|uniref:Uncharacterized protein n=1 Tax=Portunus trituberculatus TaxID=210409 RepID=A0A5B7GF95_PORTR|nr:hypothetical protein [Portunus trituberculatus]